MQNIPLYSIFTAITEIFVTIIVLYTIISNMRGKKLKWKLLFIAIVFESLVNVSYMVYRLFGFAAERIEITSKLLRSLVGFHGVLSFIMLTLLIILSYVAYKESKNDKNFFQEHKLISIIFITLWLISIISGYIFFVLFYIVP